MSDKQKNILDEEYFRLKKFFLIFSDRFMGFGNIPPEVRPGFILENLEKSSPSKAKKALLISINDAIEVSGDWLPEQVARFDSELQGEQAITLSELRRIYSKKYLSLLRRGVIGNAREYYFLKGAIDGGSIEIGATERDKLASMFAEYENRSGK